MHLRNESPRPHQNGPRKSPGPRNLPKSDTNPKLRPWLTAWRRSVCQNSPFASSDMCSSRGANLFKHLQATAPRKIQLFGRTVGTFVGITLQYCAHSFSIERANPRLSETDCRTRFFSVGTLGTLGKQWASRVPSRSHVVGTLATPSVLRR
jgi:hypothetical protein